MKRIDDEIEAIYNILREMDESGSEVNGYEVREWADRIDDLMLQIKLKTTNRKETN